MREVQEASDLIVNSAQEFWQSIGAFMPKLLGAILLIIIGALFAKGAEVLVRRILEFFGVNKLKKNKNVNQTLKKTGLDLDFVNIAGRVSFWVIILIFAMAIAEVLELGAMRDVLRELLSYLPSVLAAAIVLTVTIAGARLVRDAVSAGLSHLSVDYAGTIATVSQWAIIVFGTLMTLDQLGFDTTILAANITLIVGGVVLTLTLAFGLGGRELAAKLLNDAYEKIRQRKQ